MPRRISRDPVRGCMQSDLETGCNRRGDAYPACNMATTDAGSQTVRAALALRELILEGALRPGERVAEIPLSERIGVSRTPLRLPRPAARPAGGAHTAL